MCRTWAVPSPAAHSRAKCLTRVRSRCVTSPRALWESLSPSWVSTLLAHGQLVFLSLIPPNCTAECTWYYNLVLHYLVLHFVFVALCNLNSVDHHCASPIVIIWRGNSLSFTRFLFPATNLVWDNLPKSIVSIMDPVFWSRANKLHGITNLLCFNKFTLVFYIISFS